ncbi:MAG TPA: hypothetical protein PLX89_23130 [Verrucomicrobiota bacterium]|nr:hypothetical protein [Verrucomicrobiales bacterium]HRI15902.1 hypothetical protein [Verrucomicrobiota bacterium]
MIRLARVVAFASAADGSRNAQRDQEIEPTWCGDFQRLQALIGAEGFAPTLQHAAPAGGKRRSKSSRHPGSQKTTVGARPPRIHELDPLESMHGLRSYTS